MFDDAFLARQQEYYSARAPEYDEWWERRGRYDRGPDANATWFRERETVYACLRGLEMRGQVLELACGTGTWTRLLAETAEEVTALDGSPAMLAVNAARVASPRVRYECADLFAWEPTAAYDGVVFGFWLSHVPPDRLDAFLAKVRRALRPGGALFFVDSRKDPLGTTNDQPLPPDEEIVLTRRLNDGRDYCIIKRFYAPAELEACLRSHQLAVTVRQTDHFFLYGGGAPGRGSGSSRGSED